MRQTFAPIAAVAATLIVTGCASKPEPPRPVPKPTAVVRPAPPSPVAKGPDWRDWAVTPGDWAYRVDGRGSIALFGVVGSDAVLTLRCDRMANMLYLSRSGSAVAPLTLRTSSLARTVTVQPTGAAPAYVATALTPRDPVLDALAFSRGRFIVEQPGAATLVVPAWAEVGRVIEDCRR